MSRTKKAPTYKFGIEITKPFSQEMYDHNNAIALEMKRHILSEIHLVYSQAKGDIAVNGGMSTGEEKLQNIVKCFTGCGYGDGFDLDEIRDEGINTLANVENWSLHQEYGYLCSEGIVPKIKMKMLGFDKAADGCWDCYWTDTGKPLVEKISEVIKNIDGAELGYVNKGSDSEYPYVKVYTKGQAEDVVNALESIEIASEVDLYEDDDGEGDDGRPIILQRWSVKLIENDWVPNC